MTEVPAPAQPDVRWYMTGLSCWFVGAGTQGTLFPWLIAVLLGESALRVGTAQTLVMLPALLLMLLGGAIADRTDGRSLLIGLHGLAAVPPLALAAVIELGHISYEAIIVYALAMGVIASLVIPTRDALLSRVAGNDLSRMVTLSILIQVTSQIVGTVAGGAAATVGGSWVLLFQGAANGVGALACARLSRVEVPPKPESRGQLAEIRDGLRELVRTPRLLPVTLLSSTIGLLFLGGILVAMPLLIRDVYGGSSVEIAGVNGSMMVGMFAGAAAVMGRGGIRRQGRALVLSLAGGAVALGAVSLGPPLPVVYGLIFLFGIGGGVATPAGRTLVQDAAPASHRARILSVYSLSFMGSAPMGAFGMGVLVEAVGPRTAMLAPGVLMFFAIAAALLASDIWHFDAVTKPDETESG